MNRTEAEKIVEALTAHGWLLPTIRKQSKQEVADIIERASGQTAWVSVEERLPEDGDSVLIFVPEWEDKYLRYRVAWINYDVTPPCWVEGEIVENVTHWAALPSPPTAEE